MGLDNGFVVKGVERKQLPKGIYYPWEENFDDNKVEVAYFRKYWGFRNTYLNLIRKTAKLEQYQYYLSLEDLKIAIDLLKDYLAHDPHEADHGYWDTTTKEHLKVSCNNLEKVYHWWKRHPNYEIYFYDSY